MEYWDIYDEKKERTGRTMARNDWHMKPGDYHLTVLVPDKAAVRLIHTYRNDSPKEQNNYFVDIYEVRLPFTESAVTVQKEEVKGFALLDPQAVRALGERGEILHYAHFADLF